MGEMEKNMEIDVIYNALKGRQEPELVCLSPSSVDKPQPQHANPYMVPIPQT